MVDQAEDTAVGQLLARIFEEFRKTERRVGEIQSSIGTVDEVIGAVQALALISIGQDGQLPVLLETRHTAVAVFVDGESLLRIEREAIGTGLAVFADVHSRVAAMRAINRNSVIL